jgi:hypothetical protein
LRRLSFTVEGLAVNTKLLIVVLFGVLLAAGFGATLLVQDARHESADRSTEDGTLQALTTRIGQLEHQITTQGQELTMLRDRLDVRDQPLPTRPANDSVSEAAKDVTVERAVVQAAPSLVAPDGEASPVLEKSVRAVMDRVKDEEKQAELAKEKEQREKRVKDRVDRLTPELGLDAYQVSQLNKILVETDEKMAALRGNWRGGGIGFDPTQGNPFAEIMSQREEQLKLVLSSSQLEKLDESDPGRRWMRGPQNNDPNQPQRNRNNRNGNIRRNANDPNATQSGNGNGNG